MRDMEAKRRADRERISTRRAEWIAQNGPCRRCGSTENLEIDHIDRQRKAIPIANLWSRKREVREVELAKCQVLCRSCHDEKCDAEGTPRARRHGTRNSYNRRHCRCDACKAAVAARKRERRAARR